MQKIRVGVIGCGNISSAYLEYAKTFDILEVVAVSDLVMNRARTQAEKFGVNKACTVDELLADPEIQIILNLTTPEAHFEVGMACLKSGKSVYNEKPLAIEREDAQKILALANDKGLRVGCAPDTFMGAGIQTCRKLIDDGAIGRPVAATAFMVGHGPEGWHPDPEFYYKVGGGPLFDMGPYYLTALVNLLGPVRRVTGSAQISFSERVIGSQAKRGQVIKVETPTHLVGVLDFTNGVVGTLITSFDVWEHSLPRIEIYGSEGSLSVPDPNTFGGPVSIWQVGKREWVKVPLLPLRAANSRSLGLADMATAMLNGRAHRASGDLAYHILDIMHAVIEASNSGRHVHLASTVKRPEAMVVGLPPGILEK
jgi:predicted dehydrogenase